MLIPTPDLLSRLQKYTGASSSPVSALQPQPLPLPQAQGGVSESAIRAALEGALPPPPPTAPTTAPAQAPAAQPPAAPPTPPAPAPAQAPTPTGRNTPEYNTKYTNWRMEVGRFYSAWLDEQKRPRVEEHIRRLGQQAGIDPQDVEAEISSWELIAPAKKPQEKDPFMDVFRWAILIKLMQS